MSFLTIAAVIVFTALFAILFQVGFKQMNLLASTSPSSTGHRSPDGAEGRNKLKGKRERVRDHITAQNERNKDNPGR